MPPRIVAENLALPRGLAGWLVAREMNRRNTRMNAFALETLEAQPDDDVLEVGFGGGLNLSALVAASRSVTGVDPSRDMTEAARRRFGRAVRAGRATFLEGRVEALPLGDRSVDKAITVNTVYFWTSLDAGLAEIARVLRPGGRLVVGFLPAEHMAKMRFPAEIFTLRTPEAVTDALARHGFGSAQLLRPAADTPWAAVVGRRG